MTDLSLSSLVALEAPPEVPANFPLKDSPLEFRLALLEALGMTLAEDQTHINHADGRKVLDPYVDEWVRVDRMMILPGSVMVLDDNLVSLACYLEEHGDGL